jgi:hypothetical protein
MSSHPAWQDGIETDKWASLYAAPDKPCNCPLTSASIQAYKEKRLIEKMTCGVPVLVCHICGHIEASSCHTERVAKAAVVGTPSGVPQRGGAATPFSSTLQAALLRAIPVEYIPDPHLRAMTPRMRREIELQELFGNSADPLPLGSSPEDCARWMTRFIPTTRAGCERMSAMALYNVSLIVPSIERIGKVVEGLTPETAYGPPPARIPETPMGEPEAPELKLWVAAADMAAGSIERWMKAPLAGTQPTTGTSAAPTTDSTVPAAMSSSASSTSSSSAPHAFGSAGEDDVETADAGGRRSEEAADAEADEILNELPIGGAVGIAGAARASRSLKRRRSIAEARVVTTAPEALGGLEASAGAVGGGERRRRYTIIGGASTDVGGLSVSTSPDTGDTVGGSTDQGHASPA